MFNAQVCQVSGGYMLQVVDVPMWALVVEAVNDHTCQLLRHGLCGAWEWRTT